MTRALRQVFSFYLRRRVHYRSWSSGNAAIAVLASDGSGVVEVTLQTKLTQQHVFEGKALLMVEEWVNPRGGKRVADMDLTYEMAVSLYQVLGEVLRDAKVIRRCEHIFGQDDSSTDNIFHEETHGVH